MAIFLATVRCEVTIYIPEHAIAEYILAEAKDSQPLTIPVQAWIQHAHREKLVCQPGPAKSWPCGIARGMPYSVLGQVSSTLKPDGHTHEIKTKGRKEVWSLSLLVFRFVLCPPYCFSRFVVFLSCFSALIFSISVSLSQSFFLWIPSVVSLVFFAVHVLSFVLFSCLYLSVFLLASFISVQ